MHTSSIRLQRIDMKGILVAVLIGFASIATFNTMPAHAEERSAENRSATAAQKSAAAKNQPAAKKSKSAKKSTAPARKSKKATPAKKATKGNKAKK